MATNLRATSFTPLPASPVNIKTSDDDRWASAASTEAQGSL
jgi:hypothetical protein